MSGLILEPSRTAVLAIHLQQGFVGMPGIPHTTTDVVAKSARLLAAARRTGARPVLVYVGGQPDGADRPHEAVDKLMRMSTTQPPDWMDFVSELDHQPDDIAICKRHWGAFCGTDLDLQLRRRGLATIVFCGIATEFGVECTARDAFERGYNLVFASDAMTGQSAEGHANAIERIFPRMGWVCSTEEVIAALER